MPTFAFAVSITFPALTTGRRASRCATFEKNYNRNDPSTDPSQSLVIAADFVSHDPDNSRMVVDADQPWAATLGGCRSIWAQGLNECWVTRQGHNNSLHQICQAALLIEGP